MTETRVCMVISSFRPVVGGAERRTERLCRGLLEKGIKVVVLTRRYPSLPPFQEVDGIPVFRLGHQSREKLGALTFAFHALARIALRHNRFPIVHVQSQDVPLLVGILAKLLLGRKLVITIRNDPQKVFGEMSSWRTVLVNRLADVVAGLSPEMIDQLKDAGVPRERIALLPGGVDSAVFRPPSPEERRRARLRLSIEEDTVLFLFVGRLAKNKALDVLLRAWQDSASVASRRLLIVGGGDQEQNLKGMQAKLDLEDVSFVGEIGDVLECLHSADVFVLPSRWEGVSNALLEAMSTGLPVLASDIPGNRAVIAGTGAGLLVPTGDVEALAQGLSNLQVAAARNAMGVRARAAVQAHYSLRASIERHCELYHTLGVGPSSPGASRQ